MTDRDEMLVECDLLQGNVNRMCVTDSMEELDKMCSMAMSRVAAIRTYNARRLIEGENNDEP